MFLLAEDGLFILLDIVAFLEMNFRRHEKSTSVSLVAYNVTNIKITFTKFLE